MVDEGSVSRSWLRFRRHRADRLAVCLISMIAFEVLLLVLPAFMTDHRSVLLGELLLRQNPAGDLIVVDVPPGKYRQTAKPDDVRFAVGIAVRREERTSPWQFFWPQVTARLDDDMSPAVGGYFTGRFPTAAERSKLTAPLLVETDSRYRDDVLLPIPPKRLDRGAFVLINLRVLSLVAYLLLAAMFVRGRLRRRTVRRRQERGECPECGYPGFGLSRACSECGFRHAGELFGRTE